MGVVFGIAVTLGATIGVGILRRPGIVAAQMGSAWAALAMWAAGGVYAMLGVLSVAELGTMLPRAGGFYVFGRRAFGEAPGFTIGWCDWLQNCIALAYGAITIGELSAGLLPPYLAGHNQLLAIALIVLFALLQGAGLRTSSRTQESTSLLIALGFVALIVSCFIFGGAGWNSSFQAVSPQRSLGMLLAGAVIAFQSVVISYDGWYEAIYFTEEDRDPARNLPRSMIGAVLLVTAMYLLINAALLYVLPLPRLAASELPAADAAQVLFGGSGGKIITVLSVLTMPPFINACLLGATRILFAMSRDGIVWSEGAQVGKGGTPQVAMALSALASIALVASGTFERLLAMAGFFYVVMYCAAFIALFVLRKKEPELPRPFRAWGYPWTTIVVLTVSVAFLAGAVLSDRINSLWALGLIALSYPVYLLIRKTRDIVGGPAS